MYTQLLSLAKGTPMEEMDYGDIFKCLPKEKQKALSDKWSYFAEKTDIEKYRFIMKRSEESWKIDAVYYGGLNDTHWRREYYF